MATPEQWMTLAFTQYEAAGHLRQKRLWSPSVSRAYYAAFAAAHALVLRIGRTQPRDRLGTWSHKTLPDVLARELQQARGFPTHTLNQIVSKLTALRHGREVADYAPGISIDAEYAGRRLSDARTFIEMAEGGS